MSIDISSRRLAAAMLVVLTVSFAGCSGSNKPDVPQASQPGFRDQAAESGIDFRMTFLSNEQGETFKVNLYDHGCGVAVGDYDGDGHDDFYLLNQLGPNALYRNRGNGTFENVTDKLGVALDDRICVGATFSDYDNDGDQDLFVTSTRGGNVLFRNEGGKLVDATQEAGLEHVGHSQTAALFDYNNDGLLDMFVVQTAAWTTDEFDVKSKYYIGMREFNGVMSAAKEFNILYRNQGDGTFADVTAESGLRGLGWAGDVAAFDYDEDGWMDVLVTSMFGRAQLYRNNRDGAFVDVTLDTLGRTSFGGMGVKVFDFDNDGKLDIYIVDMHSDMWMGADFRHDSLPIAKQKEKSKFDTWLGPNYESPAARMEVERMLGFRYEDVKFGNTFYKNLGNGKFQEMSELAGLETYWPWGIATGDFDNDGDVDVFLPSGMGYPFYYWKNYLLMNDGKGHFVERSKTLGIEPPKNGQFLKDKIRGRKCARSSRCAATGDFDGDGQLEIIVNNFNHEPYYYKNVFPQANYVALRLTGSRSNRDAVGALVTVTSGRTTRVRQVQAAGGYLSQSSKTLHFGLGKLKTVDTIKIRWPSGLVQTLKDLEINKRHEIHEPPEDGGESTK